MWKTREARVRRVLLGMILGIVSVGAVEGQSLKKCQTKQDKVEGCMQRMYIYDNEHLWVETPYKEGKINGVVKAYDEHGKLMGEAPYKDGKMVGTSKRYHKNGKLKLETPDDRGNGVGRIYDENEQLLAVMTFKNYELISVQCANGRTLTDDEMHFVNGNPNFYRNNPSKMCPSSPSDKK